MLKLIVVAEAPPWIVWVVASTCLSGITVVSYAPTVTVLAITVPPRYKVNDPAVPAVLATRMSVTTVVVAAGTVYNVVVTVVDAAPLKRALDVCGISYLLVSANNDHSKI
jgi:hypothetical protein